MDTAQNEPSTKTTPQYGYPSAPYATAPVPFNDSLQVTGAQILRLLSQAQTSLQDADNLIRRAYGRRLTEWFVHQPGVPEIERSLVASYFSAYHTLTGLASQVKAEMAKK